VLLTAFPVTPAVDREVHQDHYHTTVQPIQHQEDLPEKHTHQMRDVEQREIELENVGETKQRLEQEATDFKDTCVTDQTQHTASQVPAVQGDHVHHHGSLDLIHH
jgi:hypothetical protein